MAAYRVAGMAVLATWLTISCEDESSGAASALSTPPAPKAGVVNEGEPADDSSIISIESEYVHRSGVNAQGQWVSAGHTRVVATVTLPNVSKHDTRVIRLWKLPGRVTCNIGKTPANTLVLLDVRSKP